MGVYVNWSHDAIPDADSMITLSGTSVLTMGVTLNLYSAKIDTLAGGEFETTGSKQFNWYLSFLNSGIYSGGAIDATMAFDNVNVTLDVVSDTGANTIAVNWNTIVDGYCADATCSAGATTDSSATYTSSATGDVCTETWYVGASDANIACVKVEFDIERPFDAADNQDYLIDPESSVRVFTGWVVAGTSNPPYKQDFTTGYTVDFNTWLTAADKYTGAFNMAASLGFAALCAMGLYA